MSEKHKLDRAGSSTPLTAEHELVAPGIFAHRQAGRLAGLPLFIITQAIYLALNLEFTMKACA